MMGMDEVMFVATLVSIRQFAVTDVVPSYPWLKTRILFATHPKIQRKSQTRSEILVNFTLRTLCRSVSHQNLVRVCVLSLNFWDVFRKSILVFTTGSRNHIHRHRNCDTDESRTNMTSSSHPSLPRNHLTSLI